MPNDFSVQLPDANGIVGAPVQRVGPNPFDAVLNTMSRGIEQFGQDMRERAQNRKAAEKQAREDREKERAREATNFTVQSLLKYNQEYAEDGKDPLFNFVAGVPSSLNLEAPGAGNASVPTGTIDPATSTIEGAVASGAVTSETVAEVEAQIEQQAETITNLDTAVSQGTMPPSAKLAAVDRILQETMSLFPDVDASVILSVMEKAGVKSHMFRFIRRENENFESLDEARRTQMGQALEKGMEVLGPKAASMPDSQIIAVGMEWISSEAEQDLILKNLEIQKKEGELTAAQTALAEKEAAGKMTGIMTQQYYAIMSPYIKAVNELILAMPEAGSNPALEEQFSLAMDELQAQANIAKNEIIAKITTSGHPDALNISKQVGEQFDTMFRDTILTPLENRDSRTSKLLKKLEDRLGLTMKQSYPFIAGMKQIGVSMDLADVLIDTLDDNARTRLAAEISNLSQFNLYDTLERSSAAIQLTEIAAIMMGNKTLNELDLDPKKAAQYFKQVNNATKVLSRKVGQGDYTVAPEFVNGIAEVAVAAGQLSPGASTQTLANAVYSLSGPSHTNAASLNRLSGGASSDVSSDEARLVGTGARAAMATAMIGLKSKDRTFGFHRVFFNEKTLKWAVDFNESAWRQSAVSRSGYDPMDTKLGINRGGTRARPEIPSEALLLARSLNTAQEFLLNTKELDGSMPKVSDKELSLWYSTGKVPKAIREQEAAEAKERKKDGAADVFKAIEALRENVRANGFDFDVPAILNDGGVPINPQGMAELPEAGRQMADAATKAGLSPFVVAGVLSNVQHESGFNNSAVGDNGTAFGFFQHRGDRVENHIEVTGVHPREATPEQAIQFFVWELNNPEKAGMTKKQADEIRNAKSAEEAAMLIQKYYERPRNVDPRRGSAAGTYYGTLYGE